MVSESHAAGRIPTDPAPHDTGISDQHLNVDTRAPTDFAQFLKRLGCNQQEVTITEKKLRTWWGRGWATNGMPTWSRIKSSSAALQTRLALSDTQLRKIALATPELLGYRAEVSVLPKLTALQTRLALSDEQLRKVVLAKPNLLYYNFESNLLPKLGALQSRLELSDTQLQRIVMVQPRIATCDFKSNLGPKLDYLQSAASLTLSELRDRVIAFPPMLAYSTARRYQPRYAACRAAGVDATAVLATITKRDAEFGAYLGRRRKLSSAKA